MSHILTCCSIDTDSVAIAMTDELDDIVKPLMKEEWTKQKWTWFVQDHNDAYQTRLPGLMKEEWSTTNGAFVAYVCNNSSITFNMFKLDWHLKVIWRIVLIKKQSEMMRLVKLRQKVYRNYTTGILMTITNLPCTMMKFLMRSIIQSRNTMAKCER